MPQWDAVRSNEAIGELDRAGHVDDACHLRSWLAGSNGSAQSPSARPSQRLGPHGADRACGHAFANGARFLEEYAVLDQDSEDSTAGLHCHAENRVTSPMDEWQGMHRAAPHQPPIETCLQHSPIQKPTLDLAIAEWFWGALRHTRPPLAGSNTSADPPEMGFGEKVVQASASDQQPQPPAPAARLRPAPTATADELGPDEETELWKRSNLEQVHEECFVHVDECVLVPIPIHGKGLPTLQSCTPRSAYALANGE